MTKIIHKVRFLLTLTSLLLIVNSCKNSCEDVECKNGGTCFDGTCNCPTGYSGSDCGTETRANFIGTYNVSESCPNLTTYTVNIAIDTSNILKVDISNFYNEYFSNLVHATINGALITIPSQAPDNNGKFVSGNGNFVPPDQIVWNYTVTDASGSHSCSNSTWIK